MIWTRPNWDQTRTWAWQQVPFQVLFEVHFGVLLQVPLKHPLEDPLEESLFLGPWTWPGTWPGTWPWTLDLAWDLKLSLTIWNCKMSDTKHHLLLKLSSSIVFRPNPYSWWWTKTYQLESTHNAKMYIISKTNYLSFTCRWGRCSGVAPACLVSVRQTIGICSRPPPPLGLGLSISLIFLYPEKCALLWPTGIRK